MLSHLYVTINRKIKSCIHKEIPAIFELDLIHSIFVGDVPGTFILQLRDWIIEAERDTDGLLIPEYGFYGEVGNYVAYGIITSVENLEFEYDYMNITGNYVFQASVLLYNYLWDYHYETFQSSLSWLVMDSKDSWYYIAGLYIADSKNDIFEQSSFSLEVLPICDIYWGTYSVTEINGFYTVEMQCEGYEHKFIGHNDQYYYRSD